jgi:HK97 family phage portal protein
LSSTKGADERDNHPLLNLMRRPNPRQDCASLLAAIASHLLLAGNAYIEAVGLGEESQMRVRELYALRPDRIRLLPGPDGWPQAYEYSAAGSTVRFDQNATLPPILHLTLFNPLDDHYGQSPLEAAAITIDTHNAAACWNKALLDNAARPSGALVYAGAECCRLRNTSVLKRSLRTFIRGRETQDARSYSKAGSTGDLCLCPHATWISWRRNMPPPARSHWPSDTDAFGDSWRQYIF